MQIKNRKKFLVIALIAVVAVLAGDRLVLTPMVKSFKARSIRITELTKSINKGSVLLDREKAIKEQWDTMKKRALPANKSVAENEVLKAVDRWAQASRITFTGIRPQWRPPDEGYTTLECRADASGSIEAIMRFLYELEKDPLALKIEDLEVTARDGQGQQLALGVRFSGLLLAAEER